MLLGPPGSGKGTLAQEMGKRLKVRHMSTGELFRQAIKEQTTLGKSVSRYVTSGRLVPDSVVVNVMTSHLSSGLLERGVVIDGFPRTVGQAKGLDAFLVSVRRPLNGALYLECPEPVLIDRLGGRLVCSRCGRNYHVRTMAPKRAGVCDACAGELMTRKDDQIATMRKRLRIDRVQAKPLVAYYQRKGLLYRVPGSGSSTAVFERVVRLLRTHGWVRTRGRATPVHA